MLPRHRQRMWAVPLAFIVLGLAATTVDVAVSQWFADPRLPGGVQKMIAFGEVFAYGGSVPILLLFAATLDRERWRRLVGRVAVASLGSGLAANACKLFVARARPRFYAGSDVWETFTAWLPGITRETAGHSFPSAHTATAVGLAVGLAWLYPRGRWWFAAFAGLASLQRVVTRDHFVSDTCWGAALGFALATAIIHGPLAWGFKRWESTASKPSS